MFWPLSLYAKIFGGLHNADAEELLPETIHDHARRERLIFGYEPFGQGEAILG